MNNKTVTEAVIEKAVKAGFTSAVPLNPQKLKFLPAVRDMCAADRCGSFGKSWSCPPACGTLEELSAKALRFNSGVLLQTTAELDDSFDFEGMDKAERLHRASFDRLTGELRQLLPKMLPMGAGGCRICRSCAYPDSPCRFPERMAPSMEACGLLVSDVCEACGATYYYGPGTLTYSACVLFDEPAFKSKQNSVIPCCFDGRPAVRKTFSAPGRLEKEAKAADALRAAGVRVPALYAREDGALIYERLCGETLLELLESGSMPDEALRALADWLSRCWAALGRAFGEPYSLGDIHLANFIWDGGSVAGFDLEECRPGRPEDDLGLLLAFIVTYAPPFSDYELQKAKTLAQEVYARVTIDRPALSDAIDDAFGLIFTRRRLPPDKDNTERVKKWLI